jgi:CRP/FNR family cyclic AMP-dependent transcriptional regulator
MASLKQGLRRPAAIGMRYSQTTLERAKGNNSRRKLNSPVRQKLACHRLAHGLSEDHLDALASCAKCLVRSPGDYLWRQGQKPEVVYLVSSGQIVLEIQIPNQGYLEVDSFDAGDFLPWLWLGGECRRRFDARVVTSAEVIQLDGRDLRELCERDHEFGYHLLKRMARGTEDRLQTARLRIMELQGHSLPARDGLP